MDYEKKIKYLEEAIGLIKLEEIAKKGCTDLDEKIVGCIGCHCSGFGCGQMPKSKQVAEFVLTCKHIYHWIPKTVYNKIKKAITL